MDTNKKDRRYSVVNKICVSSECAHAASSILKLIDDKIDPCDDFYSYACGNYKKLHNIPEGYYKYDPAEEFMEENYAEIKWFLESPVDSKSTNSTRKAKYFYQSCMNTSNYFNETLSVSFIMKQLNEAGGWPLIDSLLYDFHQNYPYHHSFDNKYFDNFNKYNYASTSSSLSLSSSLLFRSSPNKNYDLEKRIFSLYFFPYQPLLRFFTSKDHPNSSEIKLNVKKPFVLRYDELVNGSEFMEKYKKFQHDSIVLFIELSYNITNLSSALIFSLIDPIVKFEMALMELSESTDNNTNSSINKSNSAGDNNTNYDNTSNEEDNNNEDENEENDYNDLFNMTSDKISKMSIEMLQSEIPILNWRKLINLFSKEVKQLCDEIIVHNMDYMIGITKLIDSFNLTTIHNYLCWKYLQNIMSFLGHRFRKIVLDFTPSQWKHGLGDMSLIKRPLGSLWRDCVFLTYNFLQTPTELIFFENKRSIIKNLSYNIKIMHKNLLDAFNFNLDHQKWLSSDKIKNKLKLFVSDFGLDIGFPPSKLNTSWYDDMNIGYRKLFIENVINARNHWYKYTLLNPIDLTKYVWYPNPWVINAFFSTSTNSIIIPYGFLRHPFVSQNRPKYLDYGSIGAILGHELSHGFHGLLRQRQTNLTNDIKSQYENLTKCLIDQFSSYQVKELNESINGSLTLHENVCDFAGLQLAFLAHKMNSDDSDIKLPGLVHLSSDQLFFLQYAQLWCAITSDEGERLLLKKDNHALPVYRVTGALTNSPQFGRAFNCKKGSKMYPVNRCTLWSIE